MAEFLTTFDLDEYVYEALRAGVSGFVLKDDPPEQLIAAVRSPWATRSFHPR
jgi:DNA-binding NarL/FixJ family response regulator